MSNKQVEDKKTVTPKKTETKKAKEKKPGFFARLKKSCPSAK